MEVEAAAIASYGSLWTRPRRQPNQFKLCSIIYCRVHFRRGVLEVLGHDAERDNQSAYALFVSILDATSEHTYYQILDAIIGKLFNQFGNNVRTKFEHG